MNKLPSHLVQLILYQKQADFARLFLKISTQNRYFEKQVYIGNDCLFSLPVMNSNKLRAHICAHSMPLNLLLFITDHSLDV